MEAQLQQLIDLQAEQNELLKRHLLRLRFSLAALLVLTTACCLALGYVTYQIRGAGSARPARPIQVSPFLQPPPPRSGGGGTYPGGPQVPINQSPPVSGTSRTHAMSPSAYT